MSNSIYIKEELVKSHHYANRYIKFINYIVGLNKNRNFANISFEVHHILPRSMGGNNSNDNLIKMTLREHYIAHAILFYTYRNSKMARAFNMMNNKLVYKNSRLFEKSKEKIVPFFSGINSPMFGKVVVLDDDNNTLVVSVTDILYTNGTYKHVNKNKKFNISDEQRKLKSSNMSGSKNHMYNKPGSMLGKKHTESAKQKQSLAAKQKTGCLNNNAKSVLINGVLFGSIVDAAKLLDITKKTITYRCNSLLPRWQQWSYVKK